MVVRKPNDKIRKALNFEKRGRSVASTGYVGD